MPETSPLSPCPLGPGHSLLLTGSPSVGWGRGAWGPSGALLPKYDKAQCQEKSPGLEGSNSHSLTPTLDQPFSLRGPVCTGNQRAPPVLTDQARSCLSGGGGPGLPCPEGLTSGPRARAPSLGSHLALASREAVPHKPTRHEGLPGPKQSISWKPENSSSFFIHLTN